MMRGFAVVLVLFLAVQCAFAAKSSPDLRLLMEQLNRLQEQVKELQKKVEAYERKQKELEASVKETEGLKKELEEKARAIDSLREALGNLKISADITVVGQGSINNDENARGEGDVQDGAWSFDLEVESAIGEHGRAYMLVEGGQGDGVDDEVPTISGFNDDAPGGEDASAEVTEAWYEHELGFGGGRVVLTLGKVDLTNYFDANEVANDETEQFLSSGFVNNLAVEWPDDNGPGFRVMYDRDNWYVGIGAADADSDWEDLFDGVFVIGEVGLRLKPFGMEGNYRFYVWYNGASHFDVDDVKDFSGGRLRSDEDNYGFGVSFDQRFGEHVVAFLRAGWERGDVVKGELEDGELSLDGVPIEGALSFGFRLGGGLWGREGDELGVAYGVVFVNDDAQRAYREVYYTYYRGPEDVDMGEEHHLEVYYKLSLFDGRLEFTPDFQVVVNPDGNRDADTVYVVGTRMQVNF